MFEKLLIKIAVELNKSKIPYMVIGGQAVLVYGEPRLTRDIDITLGADNTHAQEIIDLSNRLELTTLTKDPNQFINETMVLPTEDTKTGIKVDFIFSYTDYEREAISRAVPKNINKTSISFCSAEDLIIHKVISGRPRDHEDIKSVLLKNPNFDDTFIMYDIFSPITHILFILEKDSFPLIHILGVSRMAVKSDRIPTHDKITDIMNV